MGGVGIAHSASMNNLRLNHSHEAREDAVLGVLSPKTKQTHQSQAKKIT